MIYFFFKASYRWSGEKFNTADLQINLRSQNLVLVSLFYLPQNLKPAAQKANLVSLGKFMAKGMNSYKQEERQNPQGLGSSGPTPETARPISKLQKR